MAQPGSAPEWGSGGRGFKSRRPDMKKPSAFGRGFFISGRRCFADGASALPRALRSNPFLALKARQSVLAFGSTGFIAARKSRRLCAQTTTTVL